MRQHKRGVKTTRIGLIDNRNRVNQQHNQLYKDNIKGYGAKFKRKRQRF